MALTDLLCKNAKGKDKTYRLFDGGGLYLEVSSKSRKYWRQKYRYLGKEKRLAFGVYPEVSLKQARYKREEAKLQLANSIDPSALVREIKIQKILQQGTTFKQIAKEWHETKENVWSERHSKIVMSRLEADIFPSLGDLPINEIKTSQLLLALKKIESRGAYDIAKRARQTCGQIFRYAIATDRAENDLSLPLRDALKVVSKKHYNYLSENELPEFISSLNKYDGGILTQLAIKFTMLTFTRTGEVRGALWSEIDFEKKEWKIPAERMKMKQQHIVPLSEQVLKILSEIRVINSWSEFVFPSQSNSKKSMSNNTMLFALYRMGYHSRATMHGFRATASTILNEQGFASDVIERQLAHGEKNAIRAAYNHAQYLPQRRQMMQHWADHIDKLSDGCLNVLKGGFGIA